MSEKNSNKPEVNFFGELLRIFYERFGAFNYQSLAERNVVLKRLTDTLERRAAERDGRPYTPSPDTPMAASTVQYLPDGSEVHDTPMAFVKFLANAKTGGVLIEWDFKHPGM